MPKVKQSPAERQKEILDFLRNLIKTDGQLTNWHLNDQLFDVWGTFFPKEQKVSVIQRKITYYASILIKNGELYPAERIGLGCGGKFEWGTQTQTIWKKRTFIKEQNGVTRDLQDRITHIDGKSIYCYSVEELSKFREDGKFTRKNND